MNLNYWDQVLPGNFLPQPGISVLKPRTSSWVITYLQDWKLILLDPERVYGHGVSYVQVGVALYLTQMRWSVA